MKWLLNLWIKKKILQKPYVIMCVYNPKKSEKAYSIQNIDQIIAFSIHEWLIVVCVAGCN